MSDLRTFRDEDLIGLGWLRNFALRELVPTTPAITGQGIRQVVEKMLAYGLAAVTSVPVDLKLAAEKDEPSVQKAAFEAKKDFDLQGSGKPDWTNDLLVWAKQWLHTDSAGTLQLSRMQKRAKNRPVKSQIPSFRIPKDRAGVLKLGLAEVFGISEKLITQLTDEQLILIGDALGPLVLIATENVGSQWLEELVEIFAADSDVATTKVRTEQAETELLEHEEKARKARLKLDTLQEERRERIRNLTEKQTKVT